MTDSQEKIDSLQRILHLYDLAVAKQERLLDKTRRGKYRLAQLSDRVLYALIKGDLKRLKTKKAEIELEINNFDNKVVDDNKDKPLEENTENGEKKAEPIPEINDQQEGKQEKKELDEKAEEKVEEKAEDKTEENIRIIDSPPIRPLDSPVIDSIVD